MLKARLLVITALVAAAPVAAGPTAAPADDRAATTRDVRA